MIYILDLLAYHVFIPYYHLEKHKEREREREGERKIKGDKIRVLRLWHTAHVAAITLPNAITKQNCSLTKSIWTNIGCSSEDVTVVLWMVWTL